MTDVVVAICKACYSSTGQLVQPERVDLPEGELGLARVGSPHTEWVCPECGALVRFFFTTPFEP